MGIIILDDECATQRREGLRDIKNDDIMFCREFSQAVLQKYKTTTVNNVKECTYLKVVCVPGQRLHALAQNLEQAPHPRAAYEEALQVAGLVEFGLFMNYPPVVFVDHGCRSRVCFLSMGAHRCPRLGKPCLFSKR